MIPTPLGARLEQAHDRSAHACATFCDDFVTSRVYRSGALSERAQSDGWSSEAQKAAGLWFTDQALLENFT